MKASFQSLSLKARLLSFIQGLPDKMKVHELGYRWLELFSCPLCEIVLCWWPSRTGSLAHCHQTSRNLTLVIYGWLAARFYRVSRSQLVLVSEEALGSMRIHGVAPHRIHEIVNLGTDPALSLHFYWFRRK